MDEKHLNVVALGYRVAGPLMTTAIALFGGESWYKFADSLSNQLRPEEYAPRPEENRTILWEPLCKLTPFNRINDYSIDQYCDSWGFYVEDFMHVFNDALNSTYKLEKSLSASMFLANQALLTMDTHEWREDNKYQDVVGRTIYYSSGMAIQIPVLSTTAKIVTSVLIAAQIIGLIALAIFIYHVPTWTTVLNAMAMARVGASLEPNTLPPIRPLERSDTEKLKSASGLFGVVEATKDIEMQSPKVDQLSPDATSSVENFLEMNVSQGQADLPVKVKRSNTQMQLELGASGIVTRNTTSSEKVKKRVYNS
jgi:hypothetical protein